MVGAFVRSTSLTTITGRCWASSGVARAIDFSLPATRVVRLLERLIEQYGRPSQIRSDNGPRGVRPSLLAAC